MVRAPTCPICDRELAPSSITESPVFPFCSVRCKQIDLLRWCRGEYAVVDRLLPEQLADQLADQDTAE
ncbi:MAG: DNA gyrase inhibitor YacG [Planctomycetaceae bacterium]|nr:DNA gyrase inhibitor YacG [Planctomycetaceae bacterium]